MIGWTVDTPSFEICLRRCSLAILLGLLLAAESSVCQRFLDEDVIVDIKRHSLVVKVDIFVHLVSLLGHILNVRRFAGATMYVLHR